MESPSGNLYREYSEVDWATWKPKDHATLMFVLDGDKLLLIRKKRGLGYGKINGPGGKLDPGETPAECAVREIKEELDIEIIGEPEKVGELSFQFTDGYALHVHVYRSESYRGEARETDEAIPLWTRIEDIPYEEMWADDRIWFPHMLGGTRFTGTFLFDGDDMVGHEIQILDGERRG